MYQQVEEQQQLDNNDNNSVNNNDSSLTPIGGGVGAGSGAVGEEDEDVINVFLEEQLQQEMMNATTTTTINSNTTSTTSIQQQQEVVDNNENIGVTNITTSTATTTNTTNNQQPKEVGTLLDICFDFILQNLDNQEIKSLCDDIPTPLKENLFSDYTSKISNSPPSSPFPITSYPEDRYRDVQLVNRITCQRVIPLCFAMWSSLDYKYEKVRKLIEEEACDVNESDLEGFCPLHYAAIYGRIDACKLLLKHGADCTRKNNFGKTPADLAQDVKVQQMIKLRAFLFKKEEVKEMEQDLLIKRKHFEEFKRKKLLEDFQQFSNGLQKKGIESRKPLNHSLSIMNLNNPNNSSNNNPQPQSPHHQQQNQFKHKQISIQLPSLQQQSYHHHQQQQQQQHSLINSINIENSPLSTTTTSSSSNQSTPTISPGPTTPTEFEPLSNNSVTNNITTETTTNIVNNSSSSSSSLSSSLEQTFNSSSSPSTSSSSPVSTSINNDNVFSMNNNGNNPFRTFIAQIDLPQPTNQSNLINHHHHHPSIHIHHQSSASISQVTHSLGNLTIAIPRSRPINSAGPLPPQNSSDDSDALIGIGNDSVLTTSPSIVPTSTSTMNATTTTTSTINQK